MRRLIVSIVIVLLSSYMASAAECGIVNGSFELDGPIANLSVTEPNGWDVNVPAPRFRGYVDDSWVTDGAQNLTLWADWFVVFAAGDMGIVSQPVNLMDVNEIVFDVKLETFGSSPWNPAVATAVALIDNDVAWQSPSNKGDVRGAYLDQRFAVGDKYRDGQLHKLALGVRVNVSEMLFERYITQWDAVRCTVYYCAGGLLPADFNHDCTVDVADLGLLAQKWLQTVEPDNRFNLFGGDDLPAGGVDPNKPAEGVVNFGDFRVFSGSWGADSLIAEPNNVAGQP